FVSTRKSVISRGRGFNWHSPDHFRIVTLPHVHQIEEALTKLARFLAHYHQ
ncbi:aminotransferase AlaT, partial [Pasteurella multocida subsp. multocida str. Anand1_buffalo]